MIATISLFAAVLTASLTGPALSVDVNAKNGDVLSGDFTFVVAVQSEKPISQVEFYIGDDLRGSDTSTPYEFKLDTLTETEGDLKVTFTAYTTDNESAKKAVTLRVDNGVSKGADFHVARAKDLLTTMKWDEAIQAGRVALKAKPGYNSARMAMARAYLGKGILDSAQRYAEDALAADPAYGEASELLTVINLQRAFNTFQRGSGDPAEALNQVAGALKSAVELRRKNLDAAFDSVKLSGDNLKAYADSAIRAGRYSAATQALLPAFRAEPTDAAIVNRLAFAQIRSARFDEAFATFSESIRRQTVDAYGFALLAIIQYHRGNESDCDAAMREAILSDNEDSGVRSAQVYLALARGKKDVLAKLVKDLALEQSMLTETQFYLSQVQYNAKDYPASELSFERCVLTEPTNHDAYVQRAKDSLAIAIAREAEAKSDERDKQLAYNYKVAKVFFETSLVAKPDSSEALAGLALAALLQKDTATAYKMASSAAAAQPSYAAGRYLFCYMSTVRQSEVRAAIEAIRKANKDGSLTNEQRTQIAKLSDEADRLNIVASSEMKTCEQLDKIHLEGRGIPNMQEARDYYMKHGKLPLITAPK